MATDVWPVSDRWDAGLRAGGERVVRAELWRGGVRLALPSGETSLQVVAGTVTVDETSMVRRTLQLTIADALTSAQAASLLSVARTDVRVWSGQRYTDGFEELVPVGVFRIATAHRMSWGTAWEISADDHSKVLADSRFLRPWAVPEGALVVSQIAAIVADGVPSLPAVVDLSGSRRTSRAQVIERERRDGLEALADAIGCELYMDPMGRPILRPVPQLGAAPVWTIDAGTASAVLVDWSVGMSADRIYNAVVAASTEDPTVCVIAYQSSGDYAWSPEMRRPRFYASPALSTVEQAAVAAESILSRSATASTTLDTVVVPNPALDVGDPVAIVTPEGETVHRIVSRITLSLGLDAMQIATRGGADMDTTTDAGTLS